MGGAFGSGLLQGVGQGLQRALVMQHLQQQFALEKQRATLQEKLVSTHIAQEELKQQKQLREQLLGEQFAAGFLPSQVQVPGAPTSAPIEGGVPPETIMQAGPFAQARGLSTEQGKMMAGLIKVLGGDVEKAGKAFEFFFPMAKPEKLTEPFLAFQAAGQGPEAERAQQAIKLLKPEKPVKSGGLLDELTQALTQNQIQTFAEAPAQVKQVVLAAEEARETRMRAAGPVQAEQQKFALQQQQPLLPSELSNLVEPRALREGRIVRPPPGTTPAQARAGGFITATPKQLEDVTQLDKSEFILGTIRSVADRMITATTTDEAVKQKIALEIGSLTKQTIPSTYKDEVDAFLGNLSRTYGGETGGVLTNQDITRIKKGFPTFGDTVAIKDIKFQILEELNNVSKDAKVRIITGDLPRSVRAQSRAKINELLERLENPERTQTPGVVSGQPKVKRIVPVP